MKDGDQAKDTDSFLLTQANDESQQCLKGGAFLQFDMKSATKEQIAVYS
jgi:hypothetical protein